MHHSAPAWVKETLAFGLCPGETALAQLSSHSPGHRARHLRTTLPAPRRPREPARKPAPTAEHVGSCSSEQVRSGRPGIPLKSRHWVTGRAGPESGGAPGAESPCVGGTVLPGQHPLSAGRGTSTPPRSAPPTGHAGHRGALPLPGRRWAGPRLPLRAPTLRSWSEPGSPRSHRDERLPPVLLFQGA